MKILHILANPQPTEDAASKQIAAKFFMKIAELGNEDTEVHNSDLYQEPPPPLSMSATIQVEAFVVSCAHSFSFVPPQPPCA